MDGSVILDIYQYLQNKSRDKSRLDGKIKSWCEPFGNEIECTLYLPFYSIGFKSNTVTPRIRWLRNKNYNLQTICEFTQEDIEEISNSKINDREFNVTDRPFGFAPRLNQLVNRARKINKIGQEYFVKKFEIDESFGRVGLKELYKCLRDFDGIGEAAAFHIMMERQLGVVKPDIHIRRFLTRIDNSAGGARSYFEESMPSGSCSKSQIPEEQVWEFQKYWSRFCDEVNRVFTKNNIYLNSMPDEKNITPRQVDYLIMMYTQDVSREDSHWRAPPICIIEPKCNLCKVSSCATKSKT